MRKLMFLFVIAISAVPLLVFANASENSRPNEKPIRDDIFISVSRMEYSDFDNWIFENLQIDQLPSYIVFKDGYVLGVISGGLTEEDFKAEFDALDEKKPINLEDYEVYDVYYNAPFRLDRLFYEDHYYVIELHTIGSSDCENEDLTQDDGLSFAEQAHNAVDAEFLRYYISSNYDDVYKKFKPDESPTPEPSRKRSLLDILSRLFTRIFMSLLVF